jgi:hypothetical protein
MSAMPSLDAAIDQLYQGPLEEFVAARTRLARESGGDDAKTVRALAKPNLIAWGLNQLYWSSRPTFDHLVESAANLRKAQADALRGRKSDLRAADAEHRAALRAAIKETTDILERGGHGATPDTLRALTAAFEALPWPEPPGRLGRPPVPAGFAVFAGLPMSDPTGEDEEQKAQPARTPAARRGTASPREGLRLVEPGSRRRAKARLAGGASPAEHRPREAAAREREHQAELQAARDAVEAARQTADAASRRARESDARLAAAHDAERAARERLDEARRRTQAADTTGRDAAREEAAARRVLERAAARLADLETR